MSHVLWTNENDDDDDDDDDDAVDDLKYAFRFDVRNAFLRHDNYIIGVKYF